MENQQIEEFRIKMQEGQSTKELFGNLDSNLKIIKDSYEVDILQREDEIIIKGKHGERAKGVLTELMSIIEAGESLDAQKVNYVISLQEEGISYEKSKGNNNTICFTHRGKPIKAKTLGQADYINSIKSKDIVFGVGPAGTGKTYIAVAMAINAFKNKDVEKIILARPAVEAGERLGFLPGDLQEKVDPYLRPLYDALNDILGRDSMLRMKEKELIEVIPLAYMRGITLENSFVILDEAQNTTKEQMKMFLTRLGFGSKAVITGDITQIDLPKEKVSGLVDAKNALENVRGIDFCVLRDLDVVRHPLVKRIINAYDNYENTLSEKNPRENNKLF